MIRVLHVFGKLELGGAESRIMDIYRHIDRSKVQFDFVVHTPDRGYFEDEIIKMGGRVFRVPRFRLFNIISYKKAFREFFEDYGNEFTVVHGHMTSTASIYLPIAKKAGVRTTVAHARSAGVDPGVKGFITRMLRKNLWKKADYLFTCSKKAGISVFGQKAVDKGLVRFVPNAIRVGLFAFNSKYRDDIRKEYGINDRFVVGHVGRLHYSKNHEYLIDIFAELIRMYDDAKEADKGLRPALLLVGDGPLRVDIEERISSLGITDDVILAGNQKDIYRFYDAMDCFVYPSRYEGLPGTVVEAQSSGLRCIISDSICEEVHLTDLLTVRSINEDADQWAGEIYEYMTGYDPDPADKESAAKKRTGYAKQVYNAGFDVTLQAQKMTRFYEAGTYE